MTRPWGVPRTKMCAWVMSAMRTGKHSAILSTECRRNAETTQVEKDENAELYSHRSNISSSLHVNRLNKPHYITDRSPPILVLRAKNIKRILLFTL